MNIQFDKITRKILAFGTPLQPPTDPNVEVMEFNDASQESKFNQAGQKTISSDGTTITVASPAPGAADLPSVVPPMTQAERNKLAALGVVAVTYGIASIPIIGIGASVDITVTFNTALSNTNYVAQPALIAGGLNLSTLTTPVVKTKNAGSVVVTLKNTGLVALSTGASIEVVAVQYA